MSKIYFVMPAYNEAENIENTIQQWYPVVKKLADEGEESRLAIANDGSKDNTFAIMQGLKEKYPLFEPLDKPNSGHGATVLSSSKLTVTDRPTRTSSGRCGKTARSTTSR